jgi:hypothetical protein
MAVKRAALAMAVLWAGPALADQTLMPRPAGPVFEAALDEFVCPATGAEVPASLVRDRLIEHARAPLDRATLVAVRAGTLGELASLRTSGGWKIVFDALTQAAGADPAVQTVPASTAPASTVPAEPRFLATRTEAALDLDPRLLAARTLNGEDGLIMVTCARAGPAAPIAPARPVPAPTRAFIVADSTRDIVKAPRDRVSASLGYEDDRAADIENVRVSIMLAAQPRTLIASEAGRTLRWTPFVQYNRRSARVEADEVDDLTLGASFILRDEVLWGGAAVFGSLALLTDGAGQARVHVADAAADFPRLPDCEALRAGLWDVRCSTSFVVDYADVEDPGDSVRLAGLDSYLRAGVDLSALAERSFQVGHVRINAIWSGRHDLMRNRASGSLFSLSASLRESARSNVSLETRYSRGQRLNTLAEVDSFSVRLGYRM